MRIKLRTPLEVTIYASAYVEGFNRRNLSWRQGEGESIAEFEERCTVCAIEDAVGIVQLHRKHVKKTHT